MGELFQAERDGTRLALTDAGRPNCTIHFPRVTAHTVGQYLFLMEYAVALMGELYEIDAFDQPGVEAGKVAAYALMGRKGFEERAARDRPEPRGRTTRGIGLVALRPTPAARSGGRAGTWGSTLEEVPQGLSHGASPGPARGCGVGFGAETGTRKSENPLGRGCLGGWLKRG